jgi:hypothetical protein
MKPLRSYIRKFNTTSSLFNGKPEATVFRQSASSRLRLAVKRGKANQETLFAYLLIVILCTAVLDQSRAVAAEDNSKANSSEEAESDNTLLPVLAYAKKGLEDINANVRDYTCDFYKRERINGKLLGQQHLQAKVRHEQSKDGKVIVPRSIYLKYVSPKSLRDREVLYVAGKWNGDIIGRRGGTRLPNTTLMLEPDGLLAMEGQRYPITEFGVKNLVRRLIQVIESDQRRENCDVKLFRNAKLNGRPCNHIQVTHKTRNERYPFFQARVFVDNQLQIPVYFASYDWPKQEGDPPVLLEEYVFANVRTNVGLTDRDFARDNPAYGFSNLDKIERRAE